MSKALESARMHLHESDVYGGGEATLRHLRDAVYATIQAIRELEETNAPDNGYPYRDGDVTVLGPEIFVSSDEHVICWKGENYYTEERAEQLILERIREATKRRERRASH